MSLFQNVLKVTMEGDQSDLILKKFILKELSDKKKLPTPFHIGFSRFFIVFLFK